MLFRSAREAPASLAAYSADSDQLVDDEQTTAVYTEAQLSDMTINNISALAEARGYVITKTVKAEIIAEFLEQQNV